ILDNLRRSLVPAALLALLALGWLALTPVLSWTLAVLAMVAVPPLLSALLELAQKPHDVQLDQHLRAGFAAASQHLGRIALHLAWLPHEALYSLDAIARTLWRVPAATRRPRCGGCCGSRRAWRCCWAHCSSPGARSRCRWPRRCWCCGC